MSSHTTPPCLYVFNYDACALERQGVHLSVSHPPDHKNRYCEPQTSVLSVPREDRPAPRTGTPNGKPMKRHCACAWCTHSCFSEFLAWNTLCTAVACKILAHRKDYLAADDLLRAVCKQQAGYEACPTWKKRTEPAYGFLWQPPHLSNEADKQNLL